MDLYNSLESNIHKYIVWYRDAFTMLINNRNEDHSENKETILGLSQQYSKSYNIICNFKAHSLHVCQIIILPYFISVHMKYQVVLSTGGIFETIFNYRVIIYYLSI